MGQFGFDFDEFGGNVDIVIIKAEREQLSESQYLQEGQLPSQFQQRQLWSFYAGLTYPPEGPSQLAQQLSAEFSTKAIYFYFGDASGWMGYKLFSKGDEIEEYSFGIDYDDELAEAGIDITATRKPGTLVTTNQEMEYQYLFWSQLRTCNLTEIAGGTTFIDGFLRSENAYIGWDLLP